MVEAHESDLVCRSGAPPAVKHWVSALAGLCGLLLFFQPVVLLWVLLLAVLCYLLLFLSRQSSSRGPFLSLVILVYLLTG